MAEPHSALRAADGRRLVPDELAADGAFEARAAQERRQLLLERAMEGRNGHSERKTPVTVPSTWTKSA
jgi:hypothetical protein